MSAIARAGGNTTPQLVLDPLARRQGRRGRGALHRRYTQEMIVDTVPGSGREPPPRPRVPLVGLTARRVARAVVLAFALALGARVHQRRDLAILRALGLTSGGAHVCSCGRASRWPRRCCSSVCRSVRSWARCSGADPAQRSGSASGSIVAGGSSRSSPRRSRSRSSSSLLPARQLRKDRVGVLLRTE